MGPAIGESNQPEGVEQLTQAQMTVFLSGVLEELGGPESGGPFITLIQRNPHNLPILLSGIEAQFPGYVDLESLVPNETVQQIIRQVNPIRQLDVVADESKGLSLPDANAFVLQTILERYLPIEFTEYPSENLQAKLTILGMMLLDRGIDTINTHPQIDRDQINTTHIALLIWQGRRAAWRVLAEMWSLIAHGDI